MNNLEPVTKRDHLEPRAKIGDVVIFTFKKGLVYVDGKKEVLERQPRQGEVTDAKFVGKGWLYTLSTKTRDFYWYNVEEAANEAKKTYHEMYWKCVCNKEDSIVDKDILKNLTTNKDYGK